MLYCWCVGVETSTLPDGHSATDVELLEVRFYTFCVHTSELSLYTMLFAYT